MFLCVTGTPEVEALVRRADGLKAGAQKGMIIVDCSTSDPTSTMALAAELKAAAFRFCDAPLGGTPQQAEEGKLSALVGCDAEVWPRLEPVIGKWAAKAVRIGAPGDGHKMKLLMNFCAMGYAAIYSEMLAVAQKVGLSRETGRFRHSRQPHGLRLLPDVLFLCARSQPRSAQIHAQERAQGHEVSRRHGAERRRRPIRSATR